jgi:uncharacterized Ntn-hydrolase superfamily protein
VTFTVLARCTHTGTLGVGLTTGALSVASRCPRLDGSVAVVSAQAATDWRLAMEGMRLSAAGLGPEQILTELRATDPHFAHRQVGIVDAAGRTAAYTGAATKEHRSHVIGDGFVVIGNNVASAAVVNAMAAAYRDSGELPLEDRLMRTLEAGRAAGGARGGQRSAGLATAAAGSPRPRIDLRVDMVSEPDGDAVSQLRQVFDAYRPLADYYDEFWPDHPDVGADQWLSRHRGES